ncbi:UDP-N-acetylmuramoyl-tripeptide--D-alanyl-D-alanine ligase [Testudinibacter sp. P80/BLE/0925]|uniref:UDP-N-acetylmuramoyl-tripeptide--D-alanyl-D- alanine ligase n=1 Tax=Testudinibacter sp. TW-1 TaxID=3417757 RepID=UPI003D36684D
MTSLLTLFTHHLPQIHARYKQQHSMGELADILIISLSSGEKRAKCASLFFDKNELVSSDWQAVQAKLENKITALAKHFEQPVKWLKVEWVVSESATSWAKLQQEMKNYKRNYFRSGIAFKGVTSPWLLATEMELNAHAALYLGADNPLAGVNQANLERYLKGRFSSKQMPNFTADMPVMTFVTAGVFLDTDTQQLQVLSTLPRQHGRRQMSALNPDVTGELVHLSTQYLSRQIEESGLFQYGHFPCFDKPIPTYNTLRHASSTYALLEGLELCRQLIADNQTVSTNISPRTINTGELQTVQNRIETAIDYFVAHNIRQYADGKAYVLEANNEIKLGANAVAILAFVKYAQMFPKNNRTSRLLGLCENLALGIVAMQEADGSFVHILNGKTLDVMEKTRTIYYDGEAAFGLMRLYGITQDPRWLVCVEKAFDFFIANHHEKAHDHWLSYCSNELVRYKPEQRYFQFAVDNVKGYLNFIQNRLTTFPTLLELCMAFHKMLLKLDEFPEYQTVLNGFDVAAFYTALHTRANYLVNGFFFPENAMHFANPNKILHGFFIRHHVFRVRIDDVEHYLSGFVHYYELLKNGNYPNSLQQQKKIENMAFNAINVEMATKGKWHTTAPENWQPTGLSIFPKSFQKGHIIVARGKNMQIGYLPFVAVKSFVLKGASAIVTDDPDTYASLGVPLLVVGNVRKATLDLAHLARSTYRGKTYGVTGSAGKTTTVAMLSQALSAIAPTAQTQGSANLPIGIAWNMACMPQTASHWILEMAIGNMSLNSQLVKPDVAVITNIAAAHLEYHNDLDTVALKKSRIFEAMPPKGLAVVCRDIAQFDLIERAALQQQLNVVSYGEHEQADVRLLSYQQGSGRVSLFGKEITVTLGAQGKHLMLNALAVIAIAQQQGLDLAKILTALEQFRPVEGRGDMFQCTYADKTITVINEAYNANPISMKAALQAFADEATLPEQRVLVLGDMLELGADSRQHHLELQDDVLQTQARMVILSGVEMQVLYQALKSLNRIPHLHWMPNADTIIDLFENKTIALHDSDRMLLKSSHGSGLHRVVSYLRK